MLCELLEASWEPGTGVWLALCSSLPRSGFNPQQGQVKMLELDNLCAGTLALVLEGQEVSSQQMDSGRLQLALQHVGRRTLRIVMATAVHVIPGKNCSEVLLDHGCEERQAWLHARAC